MTEPEAPPRAAQAGEPAEPLPTAQAGEPAVPLPGPVRSRVIAMAADALGRIPADQLPAKLRRLAGFAPGRRARLAANPLASALATDDEFREQVATQMRLVHPDLTDALTAESPPTAADPVEVAALAYLLRSPGWATLVDASRGQAVAAVNARTANEQTAQNQRLRTQLAQAQADARQARQRERDRTASLAADNEELRSAIAALRRQLATVREAATAQAEQVAAQQVQSERGAALAEGEARRLRSRIAELEAEAAAARRGGRESREVGTMRARLLLDALLDTAQGLRRELALPPVTIAPADTVNAVVPPAGEPLTADQGRSAADPGLLSELLALPRVHLVVDGYNVTKTAWPETPLATQRTRLLTGLGAIVARCGAELTVVFDGADLRHAPATSAPRGVRVLFSPAGVSADDVIKELVAAEPPGRPLVVASSDREIADAVAASGARAVAALALVGLLQR